MAPVAAAALALASLFGLALAVNPAGPTTPWLRRFRGAALPSHTIVASPHARFSVLAEAVVRIEWDPSGAFDDSQTVNIVNRRPAAGRAAPAFEQRTESGVLVVTTRLLELRYDAAAAEAAGGYALAPDALTITLRHFPFSTWRPGAHGGGNLHGTIRTLDRVGESLDLTCLRPTDYMTYYAHCEEGLASRDGWVLMEDSLRPRFDTRSDPSVVHKSPLTRHSDPAWDWVGSPPQVNVDAALAGQAFPYLDTYFFGHGRNFSGALSDYVQLAGPIPLLPRYALGPGFSRWYAWNQQEEFAIVQDGFAGHGLPLDGLSVDMDWHFTYPHGLQNGFGVTIEGWTGYTTDPVMFPDFPAFFAHMKRRGIYVNLNMHPAAGVEFHEAVYAAVAREVGMDPAKGQTVTFEIENQTYTVGLFKDVLKPLDDLGLDYWWIDFQHGPFTKVPALNPTFVCNYAWWTNPWRYGARANASLAGANGQAGGRGRDRPFIMGRWGGWGGHRYPVGFAGDTAVKWKVLRYETYFSPTSANVGFMWTHDIGGFEGNPPPELLTRWVQWGAFSAMLRTHSSKMSPARSPWLYANPYLSVMRGFYRLRARLLPYIATAQRRSHDSGHQLLRPMYWSHPFQEATYRDQALHQYFFGGPDIWCAPISNPVGLDNSSVFGVGQAPLDPLAARTGQLPGGAALDKAKSQRNGLVEWTLWVPPGAWIEWFSWAAVRGRTAGAADGVTPGAPSSPAAAAEDAAARAGGWPVGGASGSYLARNYSISEMPVFSPPGAIIPQRNLPDGLTTGAGLLGLATQPYTDLALWVMPLVPESGLRGDTRLVRSFTRIYDDDGLSIDYEAGEGEAFMWTTVACEWRRAEAAETGVAFAADAPDSSSGGGGDGSGAGGLLSFLGRRLFGGGESGEGGGDAAAKGALADEVSCTIGAAEGNGYSSFPAARSYSLRFIGSFPPASVMVDGEAVSRDQPAVPDDAGDHAMWAAGRHSWAFHGPSLSTWVRVGKPLSTRAAHSVRLRFSGAVQLDDPLLTSGLQRAVARSLVCKDEVDRHYGLVYPPDVQPVLNVSATATAISTAADARSARRGLAAVAPLVAAAGALVSSWAVPATHSVAQQMQAHCLGALMDAHNLLSGASAKPLAAADARRATAHREIAFRSNIAKSAGSAPGQVSQYSGAGPGEVEAGGVEAEL